MYMKTSIGSWNYQRAKELFMSSGRTRKWLASQVNRTPHYVGLLLTGKRTPSLETLEKMARALETTAEDLLGRTFAA